MSVPFLGRITAISLQAGHRHPAYPSHRHTVVTLIKE